MSNPLFNRAMTAARACVNLVQIRGILLYARLVRLGGFRGKNNRQLEYSLALRWPSSWADTCLRMAIPTLR
jgi:hypothetical protein